MRKSVSQRSGSLNHGSNSLFLNPGGKAAPPSGSARPGPYPTGTAQSSIGDAPTTTAHPPGSLPSPIMEAVTEDVGAAPDAFMDEQYGDRGTPGAKIRRTHIYNAGAELLQ